MISLTSFGTLHWEEDIPAQPVFRAAAAPSATSTASVERGHPYHEPFVVPEARTAVSREAGSSPRAMVGDTGFEPVTSGM